MLSSAQRVGVVLALVILLALGGAAALILANFAKALEETVEARFEFLAADVRDSIETGLNLGLALPEMNNVQEIIDVRVARAPSLVRIVVRGDDGTLLYQANRAEVAETDLAGADQGNLERVQVALENSFGRVVGTVELEYGVGAYEAAFVNVRNALVQVVTALALVAGVVALLAAMLLLRNVRRRLERIRRWFETGRIDTTPADGLERSAAEAVETTAKVLGELGGGSPARDRRATGDS
jgi:HAMP domain-containing protein